MIGALVLQRELRRLERLKTLQPALAVRPIRGALVAPLIPEQRQHRPEIEAWQREQGPQQQAHLGHAQAYGRRGREHGRQVRGPQGGGRPQIDGRLGQQVWTRIARGPPLSGRAAGAAGPGSDAPARPASCGGANLARSASRSGPGPPPPCLRQSRTRWASASRSPTPRCPAGCRRGHCSGSI